MRTLYFFVFVVLMACISKSNDLPFNKKVIQALNQFHEISIGDTLGLFLRNDNNKDVILFLNEFDENEEVMSTYTNAFSVLGFDVAMIDFSHSSKDTNKLSDNQKIENILVAIKFLIKSGYSENKIIVYGKGRSAYLALMACRDITIRSIVVENLADDNLDKALNASKSASADVLIFHGDRSVTGKWDNSVQLYVTANHIGRRLFILPDVMDSELHYDQIYMIALQSLLPTTSGVKMDSSFSKFNW